MARPRLHDDDQLLDAAGEIALDRGVRAVSVNAISQLSGAPTGSLYNRFGSRDELLAALWRRTVGRFHDHYLAAADGVDDPHAAAVAMATAVVDFSRSQPRDALLLLTLRPADLLDGPSTLADLNADLATTVDRLADEIGCGRERLRLAIVDLPHGAVRRYLPRGELPAGLEREVGAAVAALVGAPVGEPA